MSRPAAKSPAGSRASSRCVRAAALALLAGLAAAGSAQEDPRAAWGRECLAQALQETGHPSGATIVATKVDPASLLLDAATQRAGGFALQRGAGRIDIVGADNAGVLYGCLEEADPITLTYDHPTGSHSFLDFQWDAADAGFSPLPAATIRHSEKDARWASSALVMSEL